jgi:hypothetical protein
VGFGTGPHLKPYAVQAADARVFVPAKARFARPKTKEEAAALHDVDDTDEIRKEMEKSGATLRKPKDDD